MHRVEWVLKDERDHCCQIAVAVDGSAASRAALDEAVDAARSAHARLELIFFARSPSAFAAMSGHSHRHLKDEVIADAAQRLRQMALAIPADVPCTTSIRCGRLTTEILRLMREDRHDVVFVGVRLRGLLREETIRWFAPRRRPLPELEPGAEVHSRLAACMSRETVPVLKR